MGEKKEKKEKAYKSGKALEGKKENQKKAEKEKKEKKDKKEKKEKKESKLKYESGSEESVPPLPRGWVEKWSDKKGKYYYVSPDGDKQWSPPPIPAEKEKKEKKEKKDKKEKKEKKESKLKYESGSEESVPPLPRGWVEKWSDKKGKYYYVSPDGDKQWSPPPIPAEKEKKEKKEKKDKKEKKEKKESKLKYESGSEESVPPLPRGWVEKRIRRANTTT